MRTCTKCSEEKDISEFRIRTSGRHDTRCKQCEAAYQVEYRKRNPDTRQRPSQYQRVKGNPEALAALNAKRRAVWKKKYKYKEQAYFEQMKAERPLVWRARNLSRNISKEITVSWLEETLKAQNGRCALTGRELEMLTFEVDHIIPRCRGGDHRLSNLRLVVPEANAAKSALTDEELFALCVDILAANDPEAIGRAILRVEAALSIAYGRSAA